MFLLIYKKVLTMNRKQVENSANYTFFRSVTLNQPIINDQARTDLSGYCINTVPPTLCHINTISLCHFLVVMSHDRVHGFLVAAAGPQVQGQATAEGGSSRSSQRLRAVRASVAPSDPHRETTVRGSFHQQRCCSRVCVCVCVSKLCPLCRG